ncbi:MAG: cysteine--tRNA ligase, partial [Erysipelotrichaceae bacterium]|nr:cysteine--tRNA ligase [Erysipelotrichaceae bacterium]
KSLGNIKWAKDVIAELGANLTRWFLLSVNYRDTLNFSDETLDAARKEMDRITQAMHQAEVKLQLADRSMEAAHDDPLWQAFMDAMSDDLNTPNAYKVIFDTVKELNQALRTREPDWDRIAVLHQTLTDQLSILGIFIDPVVLTEEDRDTYQKWDAAKKEKNFELADQYRAVLQEKHII